MKYLKILAIAIFVFLFVSCAPSHSDEFYCYYCSDEYPKSDMVFIDHNEEYLCASCAVDEVITCPVCDKTWLYDYYSDTSEHECEIYCCYCGDSLIGVDNYVPYYCNFCARKDCPELFCHDCGTYSENGKNLINNHCAECYKKLAAVVEECDFNNVKYNLTTDSFPLGQATEGTYCSFCGDAFYSWDDMYYGNICEDCAKAKYPEHFCLDCNNCFLTDNLLSNHCYTCLFDFKAKLII